MERNGWGEVKRINGYFLVLSIFVLLGNFSCANPQRSSAKQMILLRGAGIHASLECWEKVGKKWYRVFESIPAVVGRNGLTSYDDEKIEGDGRTPTGIFKLRRAFGYLPTVQTGLSYSQVTDSDVWVDDPNSPQYNQWVRGTPHAKSFEKLRRDDDLYKYAIVIEYNTDPIVPGKGSAIFLHVWRDDQTPTAGCVAVSEEDLLKLLTWLKADSEPIIVLTKKENRDEKNH